MASPTAMTKRTSTHSTVFIACSRELLGALYHHPGVAMTLD